MMRRPVALLAGALAVGLLALWLALRDEPVAPASSSAASATPATSAPVVVPAHRAWSVAPSASATPVPKVTAARTHWDLCGIGRVPVLPGVATDAPPEHLLRQAEAALAPRLAASLEALGPRGRAAARRLGLDGGSPQVAGPVPLAWAQASNDAVVAAWATQGCGNDAACLAAATTVWLQLEPYNLAAHLWALGERQHIDDETLQRLASAGAHSNAFGQTAALVLQAWPSGEPRFLQAHFLALATGLDANFAMPAVQALVRRCREAGTDEAVREPCLRIAHTLTRDSDTLAGVHLGLALGRAAGERPDRLASVAVEIKAASALISTLTEPLADQPWSCASIDWNAGWVADLQRHFGEWGALQHRLSAASAPR
jgi:hypothetical protein